LASCGRRAQSLRRVANPPPKISTRRRHRRLSAHLLLQRLLSALPCAGIDNLDPYRRMVAGLVQPSLLGVDPFSHQALCQRWAEQQEVHAKTRVTPKGVGVDPERID